MKPLATNHGSAGPPSSDRPAVCAQIPSRTAATSMRARFADAPPTLCAERAAQIAEQLHRKVVRIADSILGRGVRGNLALRPRRKADASRVDRRLAGGVNEHMSEQTDPSKNVETKKPIYDLVELTASEVRKEPVKAVVWAFFFGIFLTIFPVGRSLRFLTSLVLALIRPVLLILGLVKLCEEIEERRR